MRRVPIIAQTVWRELLRKKDIYVLLILLGAILGALVSLNAFGLAGAVLYVMDTGLMMTWVFSWILCVMVSSRELPQEEQRGTVFTMLAKPITRFDFVAGKWLGAWTIAAAATLMFYALVVLVVWLKGGHTDGLALLQAAALHVLALGILTAIGTAFSTRMNPDASASLTFVLTSAAFLLAPRIPAMLAARPGNNDTVLMVLYYLLPHFELFDMRRRLVHAYGPAPMATVAIVALYGIVLVALFLLLAWMGYRGKRFSRGNRV